MRCLYPAAQIVQAGFCLASSAAIFSTFAVLTSESAKAQVTLPSSGLIEFQTSGPARCANIGDWYTTNGASNNTPGQTFITTVPPLCGPADPAPVGNATPAGRYLIHRFLIDIPAAVAATGATITVVDAGSGGPRDEVDGVAPGLGTPDPTRFTLVSPLGTQVGVPQVFNGAGNAVFNIPPGSTPGSYVLTSETGERLINPAAPFNPVLNNDDNSFSIQVSGATELLIGQFQSTFQNTFFPLNQPLNFYFLAGPQVGAIDLLNFDLDNDGVLSYTSPLGGAATTGTTSGPTQWNNGTPTKPTSIGTPDSFNIAIDNAGRWQVTLSGYGNGFINQSILEINERNLQQPLPIFDRPPTQAGNFSITTNTTLETPVGQRVCHPFRVTNNFFTTDIVNLTTTGTNENYTTQFFRDAAGTIPLTDTDSDGQVDTGVLRPGQFIDLFFCVTPGSGALLPDGNVIVDTTTITGTSFMDRRVRAQAGTGAPVPQSIVKTTSPPRGSSAGDGTPNFRLVKRITNVIRNGSILPGVNFGAFVDDPGTTDDNASGWSQTTLAGILALPLTNPVQSGDEVTYTVYFLADGTAPVLDASICDPIPGGTTFVPGSLELGLTNNAATSIGTFFTPLAPLPDNNSCPIQTNPNGATVTNLGTVSNTPGSNFGFIRFRVRVN